MKVFFAITVRSSCWLRVIGGSPLTGLAEHRVISRLGNFFRCSRNLDFRHGPGIQLVRYLSRWLEFQKRNNKVRNHIESRMPDDCIKQFASIWVQSYQRISGDLIYAPIAIFPKHRATFFFELVFCTFVRKILTKISSFRREENSHDDVSTQGY